MTGGNGTTERLGGIATRSSLDRVGRALAGTPAGLVGAYRDAVAGRRLAWASPAVFTVGAYLGFYGIGLAITNSSPRLPVYALAVALGIVGLLAGMGLAWRVVPMPRLQPVDRRWLTAYGVLLLGLGLAALVAYLLAIGYIPLFAAGLEQARVDAAEEGGAPLRVLSLLALPGTWILVAQAAAAGARRGLLLAALAVAVVAMGLALTGNRSPAFAAVESGLIVGLLAAKRDRLGGRGVALLALIGIVFVVGAGAFGAYRLASRGVVFGPPAPGGPAAVAPNYPLLTAIAIKGYLVVPIRNLGFAMDAVPERIGWRLGLTYIQPILTVMPGKQTTFDGDLKAALDQRYAGGGTVPGLLGEAYANYGPIGWLIVPFLVGAVMIGLYRVSQSWTPELAALYGYAIAHVSIGGVLSGLFMASIFPFEAYAVLGFAVIGLPIVARRLAARGIGVAA